MLNLDRQSRREDTASLKEHSAPLRIAVAGEVRTGKSALIEVLSRGAVAPGNAGSGFIWPLIINHSDTPSLAANRSDGVIEQIEDFETPVIPADSTVLLNVNMPHLCGFELVEVPFSQEGDVSPESLSLMNSADVLIWMTIGSQAWRLSEKTILDQLDKDTEQRRLLVVSRGDKLRKAADRQKVKERLDRETKNYFAKRFLMKARADLLEACAHDLDAWEETSGKQIFNDIKKFADFKVQAQTDADVSVPADSDMGRSNVIELRPTASASQFTARG